MSTYDPTLDPTLNDEGYSALPAQTQPPAPDDALTLEEQLADPVSLDVVAEDPAPLGRAPAIDFALGTFVPGDAGGPLMLYGTSTLQQWIEKCLRTRRGDNPACNPDFGLDRTWEDLLADGHPFEAGAIQEYEATIERALQVHPRIDSIDDFNVAYQDGDDAAVVSFTVIEVGDDIPDSAFVMPLPVGVVTGA